MKRVLVVGGAGYIGAHVAHLLQESGYEVRIFDDFSNGLEQRVKGFFQDIVRGDVLDRESLISSLDGVDSVIHLAAKKAVGESVTNPLKYYQHNVGGTLNLLASMSFKNVKRLVFSSTAAVYSPSEKELISEEDSTVPLSPYGATKLLAERVISEIAEAENFSTISLRYFNVVGASRPEFGDNSKDNLVPKVFSALSLGEQPEIYGNDYPTPDGTCIRDYIHVKDIAEAHLSALKAVEEEQVHDVYNVGSGSGYSVKEMMTQISKSLGIEINPRLSDRRAGDTARLIASTKKIEKELGWRAKFNLQQMIDSAWEAERRHGVGN